MNGKTRKAVLVSFVLVVLIASTLPLMSSDPVDSETAYGGTDTSDWVGVSNTIPGSGAISGNYILNGNATLTGTLTVAKDVSVNIDLNGYTITAAVGSRVFDVTGTLTVQDYAHKSGTGMGSIMGQGTVTGNGGCIIINSGGTVNLNDIAIESFSVDGNGGAIHVASGAILNMYGATIGDIGARTKGNISISGQVTGDDPWFNHYGSSGGNVCTGQGGGISVYGTFTMYSGSICGNVSIDRAANDGGGGLYVSSNSVVDIRSGSISYNVGNSGGAIYSDGVPTIGSGGGSVLFQGNVASVGVNDGGCGNGGAIYLGGDASATRLSLVFTNVSFIGNISARFGGAIEIQKIPTNTIDFKGCMFRSNHSITQDAGALVIDYNSDITVNMSNGSIMEGNVSGYREDGSGGVSGTLNGGAICFYQGTITLNLYDTEISNNKAKSGGAFYCRPGCTSATVTGGIIHDNYARDSGGAFFVGTSLTLGSASSDYPKIFRNTTDGSGGAIYVASTCTMNSGSLESNVAKGNGGAIYVGSGSFTMNGGSVITNQAQTAGAIYCIGDATLNGGTITDNQASSCRDIYVGDGKNLIVDGASVRNNTLIDRTDVIIVQGTATFVSGYIYYDQSVGGETIAKMQVNGTVKVVSADIVNCKVIVGDSAYVYSSSEGRLPDENIELSDGKHVEVRQYYTENTLYAFVMVPIGKVDGAISGIIDETVLSSAGIKDMGSWYSSWNVQNVETKINLTRSIDELGSVTESSLSFYVMYSSNSVNVEYTLNFNLDGGSIVSPSTGFRYSIEVMDGTVSFSWPGDGNPTISINGTGLNYTVTFVAEKDGYSFGGWILGGSGSPVKEGSYNVSDLFKTDTIVTFYAKWDPTGYTIKYFQNGGSGLMINQVTESTKVILDYSYSGEKEGYIFIGWNTKSDGKGDHYATGQSHTFSYPAGSTIILYAQWIEPSYSGSLTIGSPPS